MGSLPRLADPSPAIAARSSGPDPLLAPFPWFGGKRRIAPLVWRQLGDVEAYVEPFAGSLAVLLARPGPPGFEAVNDRDAYLANFWRAIAAAPDAVAWHADWPVNETDLHARHAWLCSQHGFRDRMMADPDYFDAKVAGWWVWGLAQWIGAGWCDRPDWQGRGAACRAPRGIQARGIRGDIYRYFDALGRRLRDVRVCCGDWARVLKEDPTTRGGVTGVLLDPPYAAGDRYMVYAHDSMFLHHEVQEWAIRHGDNPRFRIALCGLEGDYEMPAGWTCVAWKRRGGYSNAAASSRARDDADRERVWFSPHCINQV